MDEENAFHEIEFSLVDFVTDIFVFFSTYTTIYSSLGNMIHIPFINIQVVILPVVMVTGLFITMTTSGGN